MQHNPTPPTDHGYSAILGHVFPGSALKRVLIIIQEEVSEEI